jgi:hypothetical protein
MLPAVLRQNVRPAINMILDLLISACSSQVLEAAAMCGDTPASHHEVVMSKAIAAVDLTNCRRSPPTQNIGSAKEYPAWEPFTGSTTYVSSCCTTSYQ